MLLPTYKGNLWGMKIEFLVQFFPVAVKELQGLAHGYWQAPASLISKAVTKRCIAGVVLKWKTFIISWKTVLSWTHPQRFSLLKLLKLLHRWDVPEKEIAAPSASHAAKERGGSLVPLEAPNAIWTIWRNYKEKMTWAAGCSLTEIMPCRHTSCPASLLSSTLWGLSHLKACWCFGY